MGKPARVRPPRGIGMPGGRGSESAPPGGLPLASQTRGKGTCFSRHTGLTKAREGFGKTNGIPARDHGEDPGVGPVDAGVLWEFA